MKKEVFLAIAIGFGLGLVITLGIWTANRSLKNLPSNKPTPTPQTVAQTPEPSPANQTEVSLTIDSPDDEALVDTNKTKLTGKASANATVTVLYEGGQTIITADGSGSFSSDVPLIAGYNVITVTAMDKSGKAASLTLTITYSTAKL